MTRAFKPEWRKRVPAVCVGCDLEFMAVESEMKRGWGKFCSRLCQRSFQARLNSKAMKGDLTQAQMNSRSRARTPKIVIQAQRAVWEAVKQGSMVRQPCEVCGAERVDAHHDDYEKPLSVRWLCRGHHLKHHRSPGPQQLN